MEGKRIFVTGAARGIGRAVVSAFRAQGAHVAFCDVDDRAALACSRASGALYYSADVADEASLTGVMQELFRQWGDIDILVNNVGIGCFSPIVETPVDVFDRVLAVNLRSAYITSRLLALHREGHPGNDYGRIVNIASTRYRMSEPGSEAYAASKGGIVSLTHALALSLSPYRITVNCVSPGWIETGDYSALRPVDHAQHPSGRVGVPDDVARAILFLADPANDFVNGQNLIVDGGMTRKMIYAE